MSRPPTLNQRVGSDDEQNNPTHSQYNINYRQVTETSLVAPLYGVPQPVTTSSSYDYWWPYPPGGATTIVSPPIPSPIISPTSANPFSVETLPSPSSVSGVSSSSINNIPSSTLSTTSIPISSFSQTISASQSVVSINATMSSQIASSTFSAYPKNAQNQNQSTNSSNSEAYLIPIFVVLGIILGSVVAWIGWGCITRKPRVRDFDQDGINSRKKSGRRPRFSELEIGPAYRSSLSERKDLLDESGDSHNQKVLSQSTMFSWRALDVGGGEDSAPGRDYLAPPKLPSKDNRAQAVARLKRHKQGLARAATSKTATSLSIYSQVGEDDQIYDEDLTDRLSFLDEFESNVDPHSPRFGEESAASPSNSSGSARVISLSRRRPNHTRNDSDSRSHTENPETSRGGSKNPKKDVLRRSATARTQSSTCTAQTGFRMVEGSPLPTPAISSHSQSGGGFFWGNNEPEVSQYKARGRSTSKTDTRSSDPYTALPVRGTRSRSSSPVKQIAASHQTTKHRQGSARDRAIEEYYGSCLPQSPPRVTCPKLESSLCFTPTLN